MADDRPTQPKPGDSDGYTVGKTQKRVTNHKDANRTSLFLQASVKVVKKARDFLVRKLMRKKKRGDASEEKVTKDLEILKKMNLGALALGIDRIRRAEKPAFEPEKFASRAKELALLIANSTLIKRHIEDFKASSKKRHRKQEKRKKKEKEKRRRIEEAGGLAALRKRKREESNAKIKAAEDAALQGIKVGQKLRGIVDGGESYGVFIKFVHKKNIISGLCHISELANKFVKDPLKEFPPGTWVNAEVLALDKANNRLKVRLKGHNGPAETLKRANLKEVLGGKEREEDEPESEFMTSLQDSSKSLRKPSKNNNPKSKTSKAVLSLLHRLRDLNSTGRKKNRMGQRERKKLNEVMYGDGDIESGDQEEELKEHLNAAKTKKRGRKSDGVENNKASKKRRGKGEENEKRDARKEDETMHPSWVAKKKMSKVVEFKGKRITFD